MNLVDYAATKLLIDRTISKSNFTTGNSFLGEISVFKVWLI